MNKLSFKTTTLIAAIGMSIAAIFFLAEFAMGRTLSMAYLTIFSMPVRIARHVFFAIQLLSAAIFFFGVYRSPNQMPKRNCWSILVLLMTLFMLCSELVCVIGELDLLSFKRPLFYFWYKFMVSAVIAGALWFCYAKSENSTSGMVVRYFSLAAFVIFMMYLLYYASLCICWYFNIVNHLDIIPEFNNFFYMFALSSAITVLITILIQKRNEEKYTECLKTIKNQVIWGIRFGKILLIIYLVSFIGVIFLMVIDYFPQYVEDIFVISFLSIPVFCGIILVFTGDVLRRVYDVIINKYQFVSGIYTTGWPIIDGASTDTQPRRREIIDRPLKSDTPIERETSSVPSANISEIITQNADKLKGIKLKENAIILN